MYSFLLRACPVFVLIFGLSSCNQKDLASLNVPEPVWETGSGREAFSQNDRMLTDRLSFANSPSASLKAMTRCEEHARVSTHASLFHVPSTIPLFAFLPNDLLRPRALDTPIRCAISFAAVDERGASHTFSIPQVNVQNSNLDGGIQPTSEDKIFHLTRPMNGEMQLLCEDFSISANHSNYSEFHLREFRFPIDFLQTRGNQKCRLIALENKAVTMLSAEFAARFPTEPLRIETHALNTAGRRLIFKNLAIYSVQFSNPMSDKVQLRIPKANVEKIFLLLPAHVNEGGPSVCRNTQIMKFPVQGFQISFTDKIQLNVHETEKYFQFEIPPMTTTFATLTVDLPPSMDFRPRQIVVLKPFEIWSYEDEDWHFVEKIAWPILEKSLWFNPTTEFPAECED